ncbi:MAG: DUF2914 domain-containing protein [Gammaproteobacteria bacterium]|nr:DUF2914 domain-containing protein [Gammaproteobacteria bacterium]
MAKKISIHIDLSKSNRVQPQDDVESRKSHHRKTQTKTIEYHYHYGRIFILIAIIFLIAAGLYLLFSESKEASSQTPTSDTAIKEKHLSVPTTSEKPHIYVVYLFYEEINVLETFQFPIKKQTPETQKIPLQPPIEEIFQETAEEKQTSDIRDDVLKEAKNINLMSKTQSSLPIKISTEQLNSSKHDFIKIQSKNLSRVLLVSNIYKKEPVNELSYIVKGKEDSAKKTYLFTQIDNQVGHTIEHQWWYQGNMVHKREFPILGKRWRCYSSKNIGKLQQGEWLVKVVDKKGKILSTVNFQYQIE